MDSYGDCPRALYTLRMANEKYKGGSKWDIPYEAAFQASCILVLLLGSAFGVTIGLFFKRGLKKKINSFTIGITDPVGIQYIMIMSITAGGCLCCLIMAFWHFCAHSRWKKKQKKREQDAEAQRQFAESQDECSEIEDEYVEAKCKDEKSPHRRLPQPASPPPSYNPRGQGKW